MTFLVSCITLWFLYEVHSHIFFSRNRNLNLNNFPGTLSQLSKMMFDTLVCPLSSDQEEEDCKDSFEIFKGSTKSLCEEVLQTKT